MMNSKDLLAKLLANENLNVIRANVQTASFESVTRTLTLPQWKEMSVELEEMLIGHEVGHALYTTIEHCEKEDFRKIQGYMNVIEDVRIEKKVKNKYPGLRKAFITAYKQLNEKDFFGIAGQDLSSLLLIDRINLYYKCGYNCGVKFSPAEMEIVRRVDRCDSMEDVYQLAREIYAYSKDERDAKREELMKLRDQNGEDPPEEDEIDEFMDDEDNFDNDYDYEEEVEDQEEESRQQTTASAPATENDAEEEDLESKTQRKFNERLSELADVDTIVQNFNVKLETSRDPVVPFKKIISDLKEARVQRYERIVFQQSKFFADEWKNSTATNLQKFKTDSMRVVNYLVKEFEMRKSATEYKRITSAKSGDLDVRKLYAHTLTDDIFKKLDILPEDKNHGMVFLLDWSGSMVDVMHDTVKQVINLAMFCQRIQIPYRVFAFTSGYDSVEQQQTWNDRMNVDKTFGGFNSSQFHLLELFSNKMSNTEFNGMLESLFYQPWHYARGYGLNSTPLNESLLYMCDYVGNFIKTNSVEKMSFITLTDGEGHALYAAGERMLKDYTYNDQSKRVKVRNYVRDPMTKKDYKVTDVGCEQTRLFLQILKDRYPIKTVGFHVATNSRRSIENFLVHNVQEETVQNRYLMVEQLRKDIRQNDYALVKNTGRDEMYLLPASKQKIEEGELVIKSNDNAKNIAKQFGKYLGVKTSSRVVLGRFVQLIA